MKNKNLKLILKRVFIIAIAIYVIYTFFAQQKTLQMLIRQIKSSYAEQIAAEEGEGAELNENKGKC